MMMRRGAGVGAGNGVAIVERRVWGALVAAGAGWPPPAPVVPLAPAASFVVPWAVGVRVEDVRRPGIGRDVAIVASRADAAASPPIPKAIRSGHGSGLAGRGRPATGPGRGPLWPP